MRQMCNTIRSNLHVCPVHSSGFKKNLPLSHQYVDNILSNEVIVDLHIMSYMSTSECFPTTSDKQCQLHRSWCFNILYIPLICGQMYTDEKLLHYRDMGRCVGLLQDSRTNSQPRPEQAKTYIDRQLVER